MREGRDSRRRDDPVRHVPRQPITASWRCDAGLAALDDAGAHASRTSTRCTSASIFMPPMAGVRAVKEIGLTGVPVQRIENASATGSRALREAYLAVAGGHYDTALVLGFDKMTHGHGLGAEPAGHGRRHPAGRRSSPCGRRAACTSAAPSRSTWRAIAAKNWNYGALNPMSQRQAKEHGHASRRCSRRAWCVAADGHDVVPDRRRRRGGDRLPRRPGEEAPARPPGGAHRRVASRQRALRARPSLHGAGGRSGADEPRRREGPLRAGGLRPGGHRSRAGARRLRHRGARVLRAARLLSRGRGREVHRGGRLRARRRGAVLDRRRPDRARPSRRADRASRRSGRRRSSCAARPASARCRTRAPGSAT